ncbi:MAG: hypothetical protein AAGJ38_01005 [Planctomycetota bacterium]
MSTRLRFTRLRTVPAAGVLVSALMLAVVGGQAQTVTWDNGGVTRNWFDRFNWDGNAVPGLGDNVRLVNSGSAATIVDRDISIGTLDLFGESRALVSGDTLTVAGNSFVGGPGPALLTIEATSDGSAGFVQDTGEFDVLRDGTFELEGGRAEYRTATLDIGQGGTIEAWGTIDFGFRDNNPFDEPLLTNDGVLRVPGAPPPMFGSPPRRTLEITADQSNQFVNLDGQDDTGVIDLERRTTLRINNRLFGNDPSPGGASFFDTFFGTLNLGNGAVFDMAEGWILDGTLNVTGASTPGSFIVEGATVAGGRLSLAGEGKIVLDDPNFDRLSITSELRVLARDGMFLDNAGRVTVAGDYNIGFNFAFDGTPSVALNGPDSVLDFAGNGSVNVIHVTGGGTVVNSGLMTSETSGRIQRIDSRFRNDGTYRIVGTDVFDGPIRARALVFEQFTQTETGTIELGTKSNGLLNSISIRGDAELAGSLVVSALTEPLNFDASTLGGVRMPILEISGDYTGTFDAVDLSGWRESFLTDPGLDLEIEYAIGGVFVNVVEVLPALAGDFNASGSVEQGDLNLVLTNWGGTRTFDDGTSIFATDNVDQEELNVVLSNWGASARPSFEGFNIPEPASALLLALYGLRRPRASSVKPEGSRDSHGAVISGSSHVSTTLVRVM